MSEKKQVLFLSRWFPYPVDNGARMRIYHLLKEISRQYDITLVSYCDPDQGAAEAVQALRAVCAEIYLVPTPVFSLRGWKATLELFAPVPRWVIASDSPQLHQVLRDLSRRKFDLCLASEIDMARYALEVPGCAKILEELEVSVILEKPAREKRLLKKIRSGLTAEKHKRYLGRVIPQFDGVTTVSAQEKQAILRAIPGVKAPVIIPNGVDLDYYAGIEQQPEPDTLIYTGALSYFANLDAVRYFLDQVYPHILAQRPQARFQITGKTSPDLLRPLRLERFSPGQVVATGYLADIRPAIAQSWLSVVPLQVGGGTRLKVLESLALGTPVVATSKGIEGLELIPGRHVLVADDPQEFARTVLCLWQDPDLRQHLSEAGKALVGQRYGWGAIGQQLRDFLSSYV